MRAPLRTFAARAALLPLAALAGACFVHHHDHDDDDDHGPPVLDEQEPNDFAEHPDVIGKFGVGAHLFVQGHIHEVGPDEFDGFLFRAVEPCTVEFVLDAHEPGADLDLAVYDPVLGDFVLFFETPHDPEVGSFVVLEPQDFHLVVSSFEGSTHYTLEVIGLPPDAGPATAEHGDARRLAPSARPGAPAAGATDARALFDGYLPRTPTPPEPAPRTRVPGFLLRMDGHGRILDALPLLLTAGGALVALAPRPGTTR